MPACNIKTFFLSPEVLLILYQKLLSLQSCLTYDSEISKNVALMYYSDLVPDWYLSQTILFQAIFL